jgi:hypothetical protein
MFLMEVSSITLTQDANSVHVIVADQQGLDSSGKPVDNLLDLTHVTWAPSDPSVMVTPMLADFVFSYGGTFTPGMAPAAFTAVASYDGSDAAGGKVTGPVLTVNVMFPPAPQVTALRYFTP